MDFGRRVRQMRSELGLSIEQLSELAGLTPMYVRSIEEGTRSPSLSTVDAFAKGLDMPLGAFFEPSPDLSPAATEAARIFEGLGWEPPPRGGPPFGGPPPRGAPAARRPVPVKPPRPPLPPILWKKNRVA